MKKRLAVLWQNEFLKGGVFLTASAFAGNILNYFFNFIVAHALGPRGYGDIVAFNTYLGLTSIPVTVLSTSLIHKISSYDGKHALRAGQIEHYFLDRIKKWSPVIVLAFFLTPFTPQLTNINPLISYFLFPTLIISLIGSFYSSALQALRLFALVAGIGLIGVLVKLSGAIAAAVTPFGLTAVGLFLFMSAATGFIASYSLFRRSVGKTEVSTAMLAKRLKNIFLTPSFMITTLSVVGFSLFGNLDIIYVKKYFDTTQAGLYSSWNLLSKIIFYLLGPVVSVSFVFFSSQKGKSTRTLLYTIAALCLLSLIGFFGYSYFGKLVVTILFGPQFLSLVPYLSLASIFGFFYALIVYLNNYFLAKKYLGALLLPFSLPFYIAALFLFATDFEKIIQLNLIFGIIVTIVSLLAVKLEVRKFA